MGATAIGVGNLAGAIVEAVILSVATKRMSGSRPTGRSCSPSRSRC